jgi:hypothetical protein
MRQNKGTAFVPKMGGNTSVIALDCLFRDKAGINPRMWQKTLKGG